MTDDMLGKRFAGSKEQADDGFIVTVIDTNINDDAVWYVYDGRQTQTLCDVGMFRKIYQYHVEDKP